MSLKKELQALNPELIETFVRAYQEKTDWLNAHDPAELEAHVTALIETYPSLNRLCTILPEVLLRSGVSIEEVFQVSAGASIAVGVLSEIAEAQELPIV